MLADYSGTNFEHEGVIQGKVSGQVKVSYRPNPNPGPWPSMAHTGLIEVEYVDYSDDGQVILNGTESALPYNQLGATNWKADLRVTGCQEGYLVADAEMYSLRPSPPGRGLVKSKFGDREVEVDLSKGLPTGVPGKLK